MSCPSGYILGSSGDCEYVGYLPGDMNLDGTPDTDSDGGWWSKVGDLAQQYGPLILIGAGTWWQSRQNKDTPPPTNGGTPTPPAAQPSKPNVWLYVGIGVAVLVVGVLLLRRKGAAPAIPAA